MAGAPILPALGHSWSLLCFLIPHQKPHLHCSTTRGLPHAMYPLGGLVSLWLHRPPLGSGASWPGYSARWV